MPTFFGFENLVDVIYGKIERSDLHDGIKKTPVASHSHLPKVLLQQRECILRVVHPFEAAPVFVHLRISL